MPRLAEWAYSPDHFESLGGNARFADCNSSPSAALPLRRLGEAGRFSCEVWPADFQLHRTQWWGATPDGTVAVIHSHPRNSPDPSEQDVSEAHRLGVPIIVVTPDGLAMALPSNGPIVRVSHESTRAALR